MHRLQSGIKDHKCSLGDASLCLPELMFKGDSKLCCGFWAARSGGCLLDWSGLGFYKAHVNSTCRGSRIRYNSSDKEHVSEEGASVWTVASYMFAPLEGNISDGCYWCDSAMIRAAVCNVRGCTK